MGDGKPEGLPAVATLTLVYMTLIIKNTRSTVEEMMLSDFVEQNPRLEGRNMTMLIAPKPGAFPRKEKVVEEPPKKSKKDKGGKADKAA